MASHRTDEELIRASFSAPELFGVIFDHHVHNIHAFLHRRVGGDAADSLTGETFRIAFERRTTYLVDRSNSLPWLMGLPTTCSDTIGEGSVVKSGCSGGSSP